jgi:hypothetical protein
VLFIIIPITWLLIVTLVLAACTMAARGDEDMAVSSEWERQSIELAALPAHLASPVQAQPTPRRITSRRSPYAKLRARGARGREARSAAGS